MSYYIKPTLAPGSNVISTNGRGVLWLDKNGVLYACKTNTNAAWGTILEKSIDWGETWTEIHQITGEFIRQVRKMDDGSILIFGSLGSVFKSDVNEQNFVKTHQHAAGCTFYEGMGVKVYGNVVLIAEYGEAGGGHQVYLSRNGGSTFTSIFRNHPNDHHIHDIAFDQYEGLIWIAAGDNPPNDMIFWSADWGKTWRNLKPGLDKQRRSTQIIPLPDCVLFGTDEHHLLGVYRHDRPKSGTMTREVDPYPAWSVIDFYHQRVEVNPMPWMTQAAITDNGAYFGFLLPEADVKRPSQIWATKTGYEYRLLWQDDRLPTTGGVVPIGIMGVYGPDNEGNMVARLISDRDGQQHHIIKFKEPTWVKN